MMGNKVPGEAPYCSPQTLSLLREATCFAVDGEEMEEATRNRPLHLEELGGRWQAAIAGPHVPRGGGRSGDVAALWWVTPVRD